MVNANSASFSCKKCKRSSLGVCPMPTPTHNVNECSISVFPILCKYKTIPIHQQKQIGLTPTPLPPSITLSRTKMQNWKHCPLIAVAVIGKPNIAKFQPEKIPYTMGCLFQMGGNTRPICLDCFYTIPDGIQFGLTLTLICSRVYLVMKRSDEEKKRTCLLKQASMCCRKC